MGAQIGAAGTARTLRSLFAITIALVANARQGVCAEEASLSGQTFEPPTPFEPEHSHQTLRAIPQPPATAPVATPPAATRWYGYELMLNDLGLIVLMSAFSGSGDRVLVGVAPFVFGSSIIHGLHKKPLQAVLSPIMRVGLTLLGGMIGVSAESCTEDEMFCGLGGAIVGGGLGLLTAMVIDYSVSYAPVTTVAAGQGDQVAARPRAPIVSINSAGLAPLPNGGASVVLGGSF